MRAKSRSRSGSHTSASTYRVASAEQSGLADGVSRFVTVAQALHWFDAICVLRGSETGPETERCARRLVLQLVQGLARDRPPGGRILSRNRRSLLGFRSDVLSKLDITRSIFHSIELAPPDFHMEAEWSLDDVLGYLRTWSATKSFIAAPWFDPVVELGATLRPVWGESKIKKIDWPLAAERARMQCSIPGDRNRKEGRSFDQPLPLLRAAST